MNPTQNSIITVLLPFACCCHGSLSNGVGLFNEQGDTLAHKMTASSNKRSFCGKPCSL